MMGISYVMMDSTNKNGGFHMDYEDIWPTLERAKHQWVEWVMLPTNMGVKPTM
jgi:hypothetical protein